MFIFAYLLVSQIFFGLTINAQDIKTTILAPLPGTTESCSSGVCKTTIQTYLPGLFKLLIGLSAVWAVVMIVVGGFQYMTTDALSGKEEGKARIWGAVKGLVLVVGAWLILNEINPNLLKLNLNLSKVVVEPATGQGGSISPGTGSSCTNCASIPSNITLSPNARNWCNRTSEGCFLNQNIIPKLQNLSGQNFGLVVTEVWPPTVNHQNPCHHNGTCVDATINNMTDVNSIKNFINSAIQAGLRPVFETFDKDLERRLIEAGVSSSNLDTRWPRCTQTITTNCITGPHFSLYNI